MKTFSTLFAVIPQSFNDCSAISRVKTTCGNGTTTSMVCSSGKEF